MQATRARSAASARNRRRRVLTLSGLVRGTAGREFPERLNREAWEKVKANKGAPGVDAVTVAESGSGLKNNLYKIWNLWVPIIPRPRLELHRRVRRNPRRRRDPDRALQRPDAPDERDRRTLDRGMPPRAP